MFVYCAAPKLAGGSQSHIYIYIMCIFGGGTAGTWRRRWACRALRARRLSRSPRPPCVYIYIYIYIYIERERERERCYGCCVSCIQTSRPAGERLRIVFSMSKYKSAICCKLSSFNVDMKILSTLNYKSAIVCKLQASCRRAAGELQASSGRAAGRSGRHRSPVSGHPFRHRLNEPGT